MLTGQVPREQIMQFWASTSRSPIDPLDVGHTPALRSTPRAAESNAFNGQALKTNLAILTTPVTVKNPVGELQHCAKNGASGKGAGRIRGRRTAGNHCGVLREVSSAS